MTIDVKALQRMLGVAVDGNAGPATLGALFHKCGAKPDLAAELGLAAAVRFPEYGILDTRLRLAHFLAQAGHEADGWRTMEEYASGAAYEGRSDLGNALAGDGKRYKGRGPLQLTGRANYRRIGRRIGIDLERHPELAAVPSIALWTSLEYWRSRGINALADADDLLKVTRAINGGTNGLSDRKARLAAIEGWLP